jgi:hypothetical protein
MNIAIATYATEKYDYALPNLGRRICASIYHSEIKEGKFIFIADKSEKIKESALLYIGGLLPDGWEFIFIPLNIDDTNIKNYKEGSQLLIAQMQGKAFSEARKYGCDYFWSIESDVLVPYNALSVSLDILNFDNGYYDVAMCTYPSQGGGAFLGGRGNYRRPIEEDFSREEKDIPEELQKELEDAENEERQEGFVMSEDYIKRRTEIEEKIKKCPPKSNVFTANGIKWKQRGWMEYAYPAIGKGSIVPTDWVGLGCTLLSKKALALAHFDGYEGRGTQDLFVGWNFWKPNDINMCVTTHAICDHVIRSREGDSEEQIFDDFVLCQAYHEQEGECIGHLRQRHLPFYTHSEGELPKIKKENKNNKEKEK